MNNLTPLNVLMSEHLLDLQDQFERAHRNTKVEDCNRLAKDIAFISIAQSLINISEKLDMSIHNGILESDDREKDMPS